MDLHGVRTKEKDSATKAVTNVNLSVIGLVGTAPDAEQGTAASLTIGSVLAGNALTFNGGRCELDGELNTAETLAAGKVYFNIAFGPKSPAEEITLTYAIDNTYTVTELAA